MQQQKNKKNKEKAKHQRHQTDINHMQCTSHLIGNRISRAPELTCAQKQTSPRFSSSLWERHRLGCGPGRRNLTEGGGGGRGEKTRDDAPLIPNTYIQLLPTSFCRSKSSLELGSRCTIGHAPLSNSSLFYYSIERIVRERTTRVKSTAI